MSREGLSHFVEKSGIIPCHTNWGKWWQTVHEVHLEVNLPEGTKAKQVNVAVKPCHITCQVAGKDVFSGNLFSKVHADETVWTVEDSRTLTIVLSKAIPAHSEEVWEALLQDGSFAPDAMTALEMRKKLDLEKFQIENPGFDFSRAQLSKTYEKPPGWSGGVES